MRLDFDPSQCRFSVNVRVRWADSDAAGIAYNGSFLTYFEVARVEYYRALRAWKLNVPFDDPAVQDRLFEDRVGMFSLVSSTLNWRSPARVDMRLNVATRVSRIGKSSFEHQYVLTHVGTGTLIALGDTVQVRVDDRSVAPLPLEAHLRADLEAFEAALAKGEVPLVVRST